MLPNVSLEGMDEAQVAALAKVAKGLGDNPKTRESFQRLMKEANPELIIPEIDVPARFHAELEKERAARKEIEDRLNREALERRVLEDRQKIMKKGVAESEIPEVEKLMTERGIVQHETAAEFYMAQKRMAEPTPPRSQTFHAYELPKLKSDNGLNPRQQAKNLAAQMFDEFNSGKAAA